MLTGGGLLVLSQQIDPAWQVDVLAIITFGRSQNPAIIIKRQKPGQGCNFCCAGFVTGRIVVVVDS